MNPRSSEDEVYSGNSAPYIPCFFFSAFTENIFITELDIILTHVPVPSLSSKEVRLVF